MDLAQNFQPAGLPIREYLLVGLTTAVLTFLFTGLVRRLRAALGRGRPPAAARRAHGADPAARRPRHVLRRVRRHVARAPAAGAAPRVRVLARPDGGAARRRSDRADRHARRPVRAGLAHQARRADDVRGHPGAVRPAVDHLVGAVGRQRRGRLAAGPRPEPGRHPDRAARRHDGQRDELRRRAGRARGRHRAHLRVRDLRVLAPPARPVRRRRRQLPARADRRDARRRVPRVPAAQLPAGQDLHGRLRLDADRPDDGRRPARRRPAR